MLDAEDNSQEEITVTVTNAEPIDSVQGASALTDRFPIGISHVSDNVEEDNLYSIPAGSEADKAFTEYTVIKEIKVEHCPKNKPEKILSDSELEIYSAASTLSLGETVILSDGWLNRPNARDHDIGRHSNSLTPTPVDRFPTPNNFNNNRGISHVSDNEHDDTQSTIVLTLDVDTSASVI